MLGSNPIAWTVPADPVDFFFDCSTTVVTRGKLEMYNKMEQSYSQMAGLLIKTAFLPLTQLKYWATSPRHEGGGILPLGGATEFLAAKGYGNGMIAELFSSILSPGRYFQQMYGWR